MPVDSNPLARNVTRGAGEVPLRLIAFVVMIVSYGYVGIADRWWDASTRNLIGVAGLVIGTALMSVTLMRSRQRTQRGKG